MAKLTEKMAKFAEEYVKNGYNGAKAYRDAYGQENNQVSASEAYKLLRDSRIVEEIERTEGSFRILGQSAGLDKKTIVKMLAEMMVAEKEFNGVKSPDHSARKDAITLFAKLTGDFKEKKELEISDKRDLSNFDPTKLDEDEIDQMEKDLLEDL